MIKLLKYLKSVWIEVVISVILLISMVLLQLRIPNEMSSVAKYIASQDTKAIWEMGGRMLLLSVGAMLINILVSFSTARIGTRLGYVLRSEIYSKVTAMSVAEYDRFGVSSLITRTSNDVQQIQQIFMMGLRIGVQAPATVIVSLIYASALDMKLMVVLLISVPIILLTIGIIGFFVFPLMKVWQSKIDRSTLVLRENLTGVRVIRAFAREKEESVRYDEANRDLTHVTIKANRIMSAMFPSISFIMNVTFISIFLVGYMNLSGQSSATSYLTLTNIMSVAQYVMQIMGSILMVSMIFIFITRSRVSATRINEILDSKNTILDSAAPIKLTSASTRGELEFKDVTFSFPGAESPSLEHISFKTRKGHTTAIIGSTGSGKSTIVNLIPRFFDPTEGEILLDGINLRDIEQEELRAHIGFVPQKALLFSGSIRENLCWGKKDATEEELMEAIKVAQATKFISKKEKGLESEVAQGGQNFSGGQKQRLSIARALVKKAEIYIFDDSFSALDFKTDVKIRHALKGYTEDSSVIIVGQRVSSIMDADNIIVLEDGKITDQGKHFELLSRCSVYQEIVKSQLDPDEVENTIKLTKEVKLERGA